MTILNLKVGTLKYRNVRETAFTQQIVWQNRGWNPGELALNSYALLFHKTHSATFPSP